MDNSVVDNSSGVEIANNLKKTVNNVDNSQFGGKITDIQQDNNNADDSLYSAIDDIKRELSGLKADLQNVASPDKQRGNAGFSSAENQVGQDKNAIVDKSGELSTMDVDKVYAKAGNPFMAGMLVKKQMARGLSDDGETMLFAMMVRLDFKCEGSVCEIRVMDSLAPILEKNIEKLEKYASGFKIKIVEIQAFTQNSQVELDKIVKYFGEDYVKVVDSLNI